MYDQILVPTDGSEAAEKAVEGAFGLAERFDVSVRVIHVVELGDVPARVESEASAEQVQGGEALVSSIADQADERGISITTEVIETSGPVHQEIVENATDHDADLVVMGTHWRTGINRLVLGSVAERTLRVSPIPVLTVHEETDLDPDIETVLVPTDGSETANAAADHAIKIAATTDAAIHFVHIVNLTAVSGEYGTGTVLEALEEAGQRAVDNVVERADEAGVRSVEASVLSGTPARAIVDYADDREIDLVVMGTHGRTGLDRYLLYWPT